MLAPLLNSKCKLNHFFPSFPLGDMHTRGKAQALEQAGPGLLCNSTIYL